MSRKQSKQLTAANLLAIGVNSLAPGARWCILHAEGVLADTASLDFTWPIKVACGALNVDWDDLQESGFWLGQIDEHGNPVPEWNRKAPPSS